MIEINRTNDYSVFRYFEENRNLDRGHIEKLKKSIEQKDLTSANPIMVDETLKIIDGQHRFCALKELDKPIHYIVVDGTDIEDMILLNNNSKNWKFQDYLDFYCRLGKKDYIVLKDLIAGENVLNATQCLYMAFKGVSQMSIFTIFKQGKFEMDDPIRVRRRLLTTKSFLKFFNNFFGI